MTRAEIILSFPMERRFSKQLLIQGHELHASVEAQLCKKTAKMHIYGPEKNSQFEQY